MGMDKEIEAVKALGEQIGYGNMMEIASALWRKSLREKNYPESGAFVTTCIGMFDKEGEDLAKEEADRYDSYIERHFKNKI